MPEFLFSPVQPRLLGIKATPGSTANGCGLWGVAGAWRQHATQPPETQPRLEPKNQCVHSVVSSTFFPLLEKKKSCYKSQASSPTPSNHEVDRGQRERLQCAGRAGGRLVPMGGSYTALSSSALRKRSSCRNGSHSTANVLCCHFRKKKNPEQIWRGFHHTVIAVLFKDVTVTPPTEHNSDGN